MQALAGAHLLPAIYFVFSRAGCDEAVRRCLQEGLRLTSSEERGRIRQLAEGFVEPLSDEDLSLLGYDAFLVGLEAGIAPHHAGMVPPFREAVEAIFSEGLAKVVFATETLSLGINMPARSVVIEELSKYSGEGHRELSPGEYTQLTGRAGRRGIDETGYAAVVASPFYEFSDVARLAGAPGRPLTSSFRPTYNLAVSLVRRFTHDEAYRIVTSSFAQYLSSEDLGEELDAVLDLLTARGYLSGWRVTSAGAILAGLYHEADLLVAESLRSELLDGLDAAQLAAVVSSFCYEARRREASSEAPPGRISERIDAISDLSGFLSAEEASRALPLTRGVDAGLCTATRDWARGRGLASILTPASSRPSRSPPARRRYTRPQARPAAMTGGDFVRNMKQVIDLLGQLAAVAPEPATRGTASQAARQMLRGVVAASTLVVARGGDPRSDGGPVLMSSGHVDGEPGELHRRRT